jgi:D-xylose transport system substrate-binding protein
MATVYLAYDPRIQRQVAIKVLPRQFTHDPKYLDRFQQEAHIIAALEHPAIVPIYDFGEHNDAPYLVMRYMAGGNLHSRLRGEPLLLEDIAAALNRLAPALDYAHEVGVIHRDLKPSNILFDHQDNSYLADFGIARMAEASQTMTIIGTPAYMSPEQVESQMQLDGRSDIYAIGVMLYELLTGNQPYTAETPTGQMLMHITKPVPNILIANPDLPPETQQVIAKAMAKDREERYQSAAGLANAVQELLSPPAAIVEDSAVSAADETEEVAKTKVIVKKAPAGPLPSKKPQYEVAVDEYKEGAALAPSKNPPEREQKAEPFSTTVGGGKGRAVPPLDSGRKGSGLPGWFWWAGALLLLVFVTLGLQFILDQTGSVTEVPAVEEASAPAEEEAPPAEEAEVPVKEEAAPVEETGEEIIEEGSIWVLLPNADSWWYTLARKFFKEAFEAAGVEYKIVNADGDAGTQQTQAEQAITSGAKVIVLVNLDSGSGAAIIEQARDAGVAVVEYDRLTIEGPGADIYVSFDNVAVGRTMGKVLEPLINAQEGTPQVVLLNGAPTDNNATLFREGYSSYAQPHFDDGSWELVDEQAVPYWDNQEAQVIFEQILTNADNNVTAVFAANDGLANSVISSFKNMGIDPGDAGIPISGQDATLGGVQHVLAGDQAMTVYKPIKAEAEAAAEAAIALLRGENITALTGGTTINNGTNEIPFIVMTSISVTKENIADTVIADGFHTWEEICVGEFEQYCAEVQGGG